MAPQASIPHMSAIAQSRPLTPEDVERAGKRDAKHYELIDGELKEKPVGFEALYIASRICQLLNACLFPDQGIAVPEAMIYCFGRPNHGRRPDVLFIRNNRLPGGKVPKGDLTISPDVAIEVISPKNTGLEIEEKLNEYLAAGIPLIWIVNPDRKTIRVYRNDGTTRLYQANESITNEPLLPGLSLLVSDIFPK